MNKELPAAPGFMFSPEQHVLITAYGLNIPGRVTECRWCPNFRLLYEVQYAVNGEIKNNLFSADEIADRE